jgi:hypothetical protein
MQTTQEIVVADDGAELPLGSLEVAYGNTGGLITTETVVYGGVTYVKTNTYTNGVIATESRWAAQ